MARAVEVLRGQSGLDDEADCYARSSVDQGLLAADAVEEEGDEDEVGDGPNYVVDAGHEDVGVPCYAQRGVDDGLVIADDVYASELCENLDGCAVEQTGSPFWDGEHDLPAGD